MISLRLPGLRPSKTPVLLEHRNEGSPDFVSRHISGCWHRHSGGRWPVEWWRRVIPSQYFEHYRSQFDNGLVGCDDTYCSNNIPGY